MYIIRCVCVWYMQYICLYRFACICSTLNACGQSIDWTYKIDWLVQYLEKCSSSESTTLGCCRWIFTRKLYNFDQYCVETEYVMSNHAFRVYVEDLEVFKSFFSLKCNGLQVNPLTMHHWSWEHSKVAKTHPNQYRQYVVGTSMGGSTFQ